VAATGKVRHWKHGWIPLDAYARDRVRGKRPTPPRPHSVQVTKRRTPSGASKPRPTIGRKRTPNLQAEIEANGGFTYDPKTGGLLKVGEAKGFAVAVPGTEETVGVGGVTREAFAHGVAKVVMKHRAAIARGAVLGGWYSPDRNEYMVELTEIHPPDDREGAIRAGRERNQEAIFDLATGETINTGGTGDASTTTKELTSA
jgi:hypothetical protein